MYRFHLYYLILIYIFLGCNNFPTNEDNSSTTSGGEGSSLISISFGSISNNSVEIIMNTSHDIAGFQFTITGITLEAATGGLAEENGLIVSVGVDTGVVIGFSLSANTIPDGSNGVLTNLEYTNQIEEICITDVVLSDSDGIALNIDLIGDCIEY